MLKIVVTLMIAFSCTSANRKPWNTTTTPSEINCGSSTEGTHQPSTKYPQLYRDYVFHTLSENGKKMFYATNIHPSCVAKKGQCIPRAKCGSKMLYISRICYRHDLVCCYDDSIRFPVVGTNPPSTTATTGRST